MKYQRRKTIDFQAIEEDRFKFKEDILIKTIDLKLRKNILRGSACPPPHKDGFAF